MEMRRHMVIIIYSDFYPSETADNRQTILPPFLQYTGKEKGAIFVVYQFHPFDSTPANILL